MHGEPPGGHAAGGRAETTDPLFEQSFIDAPGRGVKPWTIAVSFLAQCLFLTGAVVAPLFYSYNPPIGEWVRHTLLLSPPPPPVAAAKIIARPVAPAPARFESTLVAPAAIPQEIALVADQDRPALGSLRALDLGQIGGTTSGGVADGVLGVAGMQARVSLPPKPIRIGGKVQAAKIILQASPVYPREAVEQGISGKVHLEAIISTAGIIREVKVLDGDPLLAASALEAVRQWRWRPTYLNGQPVEVITQIEVTFSLTKPEPPPSDDGNKNEQPERNQRKKKR
jgi:protein TonB